MEVRLHVEDAGAQLEGAVIVYLNIGWLFVTAISNRSSGSSTSRHCSPGS